MFFFINNMLRNTQLWLTAIIWYRIKIHHVSSTNPLGIETIHNARSYFLVMSLMVSGCVCVRATWVKRKLVRVVGWALDFHRNSYEVKRSRVAVWAAHSQSSPKNSNKRLSEKGIGWMGEQGTLKLQRKRKKERKLRPRRKKKFCVPARILFQNFLNFHS